MAELKSPLTDPNFLNRAAAGNVLADALKSPDFLQTAVVADRRGNDIALDGTYINDLKTMTYGQLDQKYGRDVADNRYELQVEIERQYAVRNTDRSTLQEIGDAVVGFAGGLTGMVGSLGAATLGVAGAADEAYDPENTGLSELSTIAAQATTDASEFIGSFQSDELQDRKDLAAIGAQLDDADSAAQYEADVAEGGNEYVAALSKVGRDALNAGEQILDDGAVAGDIISNALGSLGPSARIAAGGANIATGITSRITTNKTADKLAFAIGSSAGIGLAEASGTYADTVNTVMAISEEDMYQAPEYASLREQGVGHEQAQRIVAGHVAEEAASRQLPTAAVLGLLASKFNANPLKTFRGKSLIEGLSEVGKQTLEEGLQGGSSAFNTNVAIQNQVDEDQALLEGVPQQTVIGAFAGAGMAGVIGSPRIALSTTGEVLGASVRGIASAAQTPAAAALSRALVDGGTGALDATSALATRAAPFITPITDPVVAAAKVVGERAAEVAGPAVEAVQDFADRPNQKTQVAAVEAADSLVGLSNGNPNVQAIRDVMAGLLETRVSKMTDEAVLAAAETILNVKRDVANLTPEAKRELVKVLSSPDIALIGKRRVAIKKALAASTDQNQTETIEVTPETTQETIQVAKTNPVNVNPDHVTKILEHKDSSNLSDEDIKLLKSAAEIATAVNNHQGEEVKISSDKSIALSKKPAYNNREAPEVTPLERTSRSIQVGGFKDARGNSLRSVNDFAADIFEGAQSQDGNVIDDTVDKGFTNVSTIADQFGKFVTHMVNKVEALNQSAAKADRNGAGTNELFESLVAGETLVPAGRAGGAKAVALHVNSPQSVAFAQTVLNDAKTAVEVYNTLVRTFPELFPNGEVAIPELNINTPTPAVEEVKEVVPNEDATGGTTEASAEVVSEGVSEEGKSDETDEQPKTEKKETPDTTAGEDTISPSEIETEAEPQPTSEASAESVEIPETIELQEDTAPVTQKFDETFTKKDEDVGYETGQDLLGLLNVGTNTTEGYMRLAEGVFRGLIAGMNKRLNTVIFSKKDGRTIGDVIRSGQDITGIRDFKNTMIVDPETGQYDPALLSIAMVAIVDWMSSVRSADPHRLSDTLEDLGVSLGELTNEEFNNIAFGVSVRQASETIAKQIIRMWNVTADSDGQLVDARGAVEGLVKEAFTVLNESSNLIQINDIPVIKDGKKVTTPTINVKGLEAIQKDIGLSGQNSIQKLLTPEENTLPSIGEKIEHTDRTQSRGNVKLSKLERKALGNMQDTPHTKAKGISSLVAAIGFDVVSKMLGFKDVSDLTKNHPLRSSIEGKNISITRDWEDAHAVLAELEDREETPVYYPVGISKVGRHQFKGINPQNNKILRALVTPTHAILDMTTQAHIDAFWLTVAQAADLFKVENEDHQIILRDVRDKFNAKYGDAVTLVEAHLRGAELDGEALFELTGEIEMAQLNAIFAVASLNVTETIQAFETTLSFELDGKTDGPANMMNNFGQGTLSQADMTNFERVGYFLGTKFKTLNRFFGDEGNVDLYQTTSRKAQTRLFTEIANADEAVKTKLYASQRFAAIFGDFKVEPDGRIVMTRNTAKNPMTKTVYGSGIRGVASGIAEEMVLEFYRQIVTVPEGSNPEEFLGYPDLKKDFSTLFNTKFPENMNWKDSFINNISVDFFKNVIAEGIGEMIASSAKDVIGSKIINVNDTLVFVTNVQTEFLQELFQERLLELAETRAKEGKIGRNSKGKPILRQMSRGDYDSLVQELKQYAPLYSNGSQTLAVGQFSGQVSDIELSSNMSGNLRMKSNLDAPDIAGVKIIPYISIGRGDAMMMNTIYGSDNAPTDTLPVFDGIDMPIDKVQVYADQVNKAVLQNWNRDVLGDILSDFESFLGKVGSNQDMLNAAFLRVQTSPGKTTVISKNTQELLEALTEQHRQNQARKRALRGVPVSVDHMGGSNTAHTAGPDGEMTLQEINGLISAELNRTNQPAQEPAQKIVDKATNEAAKKDNTEVVIDPEGETPGLLFADTNTILKGLLKSNRLTIRKTVKVLIDLLADKNFKIIIAKDHKSLNKQYNEMTGQGPFHQLAEGIDGFADWENGVILVMGQNHETLVHEMIHMATIHALIAHYDGSKTNPAIGRLETLMSEFMDLDVSEGSKALQQAHNSTRAAILEMQVNDTAFNNAAALNEFMAWSLSNTALVEKLSKTDTKLIGRMIKAVVVLIKRMFGGKIPTDMYSHILFNTLLLGDNSFSSGNESNDDTPGDGNNGNGGDNNDNSDGGVTPPAHNLTNFWIDLVKERLEGLKSAVGRVKGVDQFKRYQEAARNAVIKLDFGGFSLTAYQKQTFKAIHMVLATEMRLNTQSHIAINKVFENVVDNLTPAMFGPGKAGQERYSAVMELMGDTKNDEGVTDAMAVLLALSQTSEGFRKALDQLPEPDSESKINAGTLNEFLTSVTGILMNKFISTVDTSDGSAKALLDVLANNLLLEDTEKEFSLLSGLMSSIDKADDFLSGAFSTLADRAAELDRRMHDEDRSKLTKIVTGTIAGATLFLDGDRSAAAAEGAKRLTHMGATLDHFIPIREFVSEIIGTDKTNAEVVALLDRTNYAVSAIRQDLKEGLPVVLQDAFDTHPDAVQWKAAHRILGKLDFSLLFDLANPDRAFNLLSDNSLLSSETAKKEAAINKAFTKTTADTILEKARQLASHMNLKGAGHQLWKNAYAINKLAGEYDATMTETIDTLVSLYALEIADQVDKAIVTDMYENDPEATTNLVTYTQALNKEEDLKVFSETARLAGNKGWIPDLGTGNKRVIVENDTKQDNLIKKGFVRVGDYTASDDHSLVGYGYYMTTTKQGGSYSQGVLQSIQGTYRGVNSVTGQSVSNYVSGGLITGEEAEAATKSLNNAQGVVDDKEVLIPLYDENGEVFAYERAINPDLIDQYIQPRSNMALMLGAWAGRQVEEKMAAQYNYELVVELKRIWDERPSGDDGLFVDISDPKIKDEVFKESYRVISPETRRTIEDIFGEGNGFMVRKDMVNLALGYRDPSIMDVWTGKTRMPKVAQTALQAAVSVLPGNRAIEILSRTEEAVQSTVSTAKDLIVVRSLIVPYMNTQANVFQLATRGIGTKAMLTGYRDKLAEIERFNVNEKKRIELKAEIALAGNNPNRVAILQQRNQVILDENARMSIAPLIKAGQYKNISEGITALDVELTSGRMGEWVENQMNKLPTGVQTIAKYGILSKDTAVYKAANKAVQYGDFLAKAITYDHLTQVDGVDHTEALKRINEEFINFSALPGRSRQYLESLGLTWFLSFKIRAMKVGMSVMRENPVRALITASTVGEFGSPVNDNLATVALQDRLDYALGWDMLLGAPSLNPWMQLLEWQGEG